MAGSNTRSILDDECIRGWSSHEFDYEQKEKMYRYEFEYRIANFLSILIVLRSEVLTLTI